VQPLPSPAPPPGNYGRHSLEYSFRTSTGTPLRLRLTQLWQRRDVLRMFVTRGLKVKYASSVLGYAWSLIEPALFIFIYYLVFGRIFHTHYRDYPLFIATTMLPWLWFSQTVQASTGALRSNGRLITSIAIPREIYPLANVGEKFVEFLLSIPVVIVVALLYRAKPTHFLALYPVAVLMELVLATGVAFLIAALNTILRDIQRGIGVILRMIFYLSPVLYPVRQIGNGITRTIFECNPLVGPFEIFRAVFYPEYFKYWNSVVISAIGSVLFLLVGFFAFVQLERTVLKEL
jgi:ABC-2 type transport system permease protein